MVATEANLHKNEDNKLSRLINSRVTSLGIQLVPRTRHFVVANEEIAMAVEPSEDLVEEEEVVLPEVPETTLPSLNLVHNDAVGGRLSGFSQAWRRDLWAYQIVSKGLTWTWHRRPPSLRNPSLGQKCTPLIQEYVEEMLEKK